mmetsp:Transcript_6604/g.13945  ORF Transcript_6604/g.13945 Transcript_6604/m.13945 type:complete len:279 (-) Transcript_6604:133-969(-)
MATATLTSDRFADRIGGDIGKASKRRKNNSIVLLDEVSEVRYLTNPIPTRTLCDLASQQNWEAALERCNTHPEDMNYKHGLRGSLLHFALWSHARQSNDERLNGAIATNKQTEQDAKFCLFLEKLITSNPDMISSVGSLGYTPLHIACQKDSLRNKKIIDILLKRSVPLDATKLYDLLCEDILPDIHIPVEVTRRISSFLPNTALMKDNQGKTPLFLASQLLIIPRREKHFTNTLKEVVEVLVKHEPSAKTIVDETKRMPVEVVKKQEKYPELVCILS